MYKIIGSDKMAYGPISAETVRQWKTDGRITAQTLIQREGATDWKPITTFPEFSALFSAGPVAVRPSPVVPQISKPNLPAVPNRTISKERIIIAFVVAGVADLIDIAITGGEDAAAVPTAGLSFIPGEILSGILDVIVMGIMTFLLRFHWLFLPSFLVEIIPELEIAPTWIACVGIVVWERKKEEKKAAGG